MAKRKRRAKKTRFNKNSLTSVACFLRVYLGLSQQKLGKLTGLSANDICHIECGKMNVRIGTVKTLADFFNITIDTIINNSFDAIGHVLPSLPVVNEDAIALRAKRQTRRDEIGALGQSIVAQRERQKLAGTPYANLVNTNFSEIERAGFDILSFTREGKILFIEVKSSVSGAPYGFPMSANEKALIKFCIDNGFTYELHWVQGLEYPDNYTVTVFTAEEMMRASYAPTSYTVTPIKK